MADRQKTPDPKPYLHDPFIAKDNTIWYADPPTNAIVHLDPRNLDAGERWKFYPLPADAPSYVFPHGITLDQQRSRCTGRKFSGGKVGELDPATGKITRHALPTAGSLLQVVTDQKDNIWYDDVHGDGIGKLDAQTRQVSQFPTPTPDLGLYGMAVDPKGNIWSAGYTKSMVVKFDPVTESYTEYPVAHCRRQRAAHRSGLKRHRLVFRVDRRANRPHRSGYRQDHRVQAPHSLAARTKPGPTSSTISGSATTSTIRLFISNRSIKKFTYYPLPQVWPSRRRAQSGDRSQQYRVARLARYRACRRHPLLSTWVYGRGPAPTIN